MSCISVFVFPICLLPFVVSVCVVFVRTLSGCRYARAQRALGRLLMSQGRLEAAAAALRLAAAAAALHRPTWFALGCCCLHLPLPDEARNAFARALAIDPEEGDAWANLAAVHCKVLFHPLNPKIDHINSHMPLSPRHTSIYPTPASPPE